MRYGKWAGEPKGRPYQLDQCAWEVFTNCGTHYQCCRKPGHGPGKLYCKQHAKGVK